MAAPIDPEIINTNQFFTEPSTGLIWVSSENGWRLEGSGGGGSGGGVLVTTIAAIRAFPGVLPSTYFQTTDIGQEGLWAFDPTDEASSDNTGTILVTAGSRRVKRIFDTKNVNVKWFGAKGDNTTDDHVAIQAACSTGYNVYFPTGRYIIDVIMISCAGGATYFGDNANDSVLVRKTPVIGGQGGLGLLYLESSSDTTFLSNTSFRDLGFDGLVGTLGTSQSSHLLALAGTINTLVENCIFTAFRADGLYVSAGRGAAFLRHNFDVTVRGCFFDGITKTNRNGISVIDCNGIVIDDNTFQNIGNPALTNSVGAIDFERNSQSTMFARNAVIVNNRFYNIDTTNTSAITIFDTSTVGPEKADYFVVENNEIHNCFWGVTISNGVSIVDGNEENSKIKIAKNNFMYNTIAVTVRGRGVTIVDNDFKGDSTHANNIQIGHNTTNSVDIEVSRNRFMACGNNGVIEIGGFFGLRITNNNFVDGATALYFFPDSQEVDYRVLQGLVITDNVIRNIVNITSNNYFISFALGFNANNWLINSSGLEQNNRLENRTLRTPGGTTHYFNRSTVTSIPTTGTWEAGNVVNSLTNTYTCITSGTFGTDAITNTVGVTNGNMFVTYATVLTSNLRQGQYIAFTTTASVFKIANIATDGSGFYISSNFDGTTGTDTVTWSPAAFYTTPLQPPAQWVTSGSNMYYTTGNVSVGSSVATFGRFYSGDSTGKGIVMGYPKSSLDNSVVYGQIFWGDSGSGFTAGDLVMAPRSTSAALIRFFTGNGTLVERVVIDAAGSFYIRNTGGTGHVLKQATSGGAITSAPLLASDMSTTGTADVAKTFRGDSSWVVTPQVLSATSVNAKTTGTTALYTVPAGKTLTVTGVYIRVTSSTAASVGATADVGDSVNGAASIYASTATALTVLNKVYKYPDPSGGLMFSVAAAGVVNFNINTGATATTLTYTVTLIGILQ